MKKIEIVIICCSSKPVCSQHYPHRSFFITSILVPNRRSTQKKQSQTSPPQVIATPARANYLPSSSYKNDLSVEANPSSPEPAGTRTEQTAVDRLIWRFRASRELIIRRRYVEVLEYDSRVPNVKIMDHLRVVASTIW